MERTTRIDAAPRARQAMTWFDVGLVICSILAPVLDFFVNLGNLALEGMVRLATWAGEQIAKVIAKLGFNMGAKALFGVLSKLVPLAVPLLIVFRRWLGEESNEWFWWYLGTLAAVIVAGYVARRWGDGLSLPLRLRYSRGSGWSAIHAYTAVGHYRRPWTAARELITLRRRLRKADSRYEDQPLRRSLSELPVQLGRVRRCLEAWAGFPADRDPRPPVLLGRSVRAGPFPSEKAQSAFARDLLQAAPNFPAELLDAVTRQRQQAGPGEPQVVVTPADTGRLITATRGTAEFLTDRGEQELPGWNVQVQGVLSEASVLHPRHQPIWVLDPDVSQQAWRPPGLADHELCWRGSTAQLSQDGRTVILKFAGKPYTYANSPRAVLENGTAVAIVPVPVDITRQSRRWERSEVSVELSKPLGSRVLLDGDGCPVLVTPAPKWRAVGYLGGYASASGDDEDTPQLGRVRRCLEAWAGFPADRDPRPPVLLGRSVRAGPFPSEKAQSAFARDLLQAAPNFPAELLDAVTRQRQQAGPGEPQVVVTPADTGRLITATRGTAEFLTDRGEQELPGWNVQVQGVLSEASVLHPRHQPIWVLDPDVSQQAWRPPGLADHELCWRGSTAQLSQDGRTVILKFAGKPYTYYPRAEVLGDDDGPVVAIVPVARRRRRWGRRWERPEVSVELSKPLGSRVLLDGNGCPVLIHG